MAELQPVSEKNIDGYNAPTIPWARARRPARARLPGTCTR